MRFSPSLPALGLLCSLFVAATGVVPATAAEQEPISFSRQILPILSDNCFLCHGPDEKSREADLRLDVQEQALRTESPVLVPGKSGESELIRRILSTDPDEQMPPPGSKHELSAEQKQLLQDWIDQGAKWGKHWAFEPIVRPALPPVQRTEWIRNPIDAFVLARLEQEGLQPSPEADKLTLLRRVSLDLTGIGPTPEEAAAFLADDSPQAYEAVVDRLLQSPRYGERMVWEWLDAARYADTNGYQGDPTRAMWYWRDWAINALNDNMPYDQFTIEQLAGDLLDNPTQEQLIATGFHRNHMINGEGGRIAEESRVDYVQDRVETTATVWMGLTFNCCRCHTHKFDPILQKEYYQLAAYFNSIDETGGNDAGGLANPIMSLASAEQKLQLDQLKEVENKANAAKQTREQELQAELPTWLAAQRTFAGTNVSAWQPLVPTSAVSKEEVELKQLDDGSLLASGKNPDTDFYTLEFKSPHSDVFGFRLETLADESLINQGPGRADNGNFVLNDVKLFVDNKPVKLIAKEADFAQNGWAAVGAFDDKPNTGWAVMPEFGKTHTLTFVPEQPLTNVGEETQVRFELAFNFGRQHTLGHFRILSTSSKADVESALPKDVAALLAKAEGDLSDAENKRLAEFQRAQDTAYQAAVKNAEQAKEERSKLEKSLPRTMIMRERAEPRKTFILERGQYNKPGEEVATGVPAALPPLPANAPTNRLALAQWLVSDEHPLMPRVTVNRMWQQSFGIGLVKTAEDFGVQGERPIHPDLLDWLASEFREASVAQPSVAHSQSPQRWNVKHLQRLIVTSATYRQSSKVSAELVERDPDNRLLARGARYRWPSWMIRDQALAASGLLVEKLGGPAVKGYQPSGVWEEATFGKINYVQDHGDALYRRSVYQFWRRIVGPTIFFDVARRQTCEVKASRTNTPLQALATFNDITYVEAARALAQRTLKELPDASPAERLSRMFARLLVRSPSDQERQILEKSLQRFQKTFSADPNQADQLLAVGESPRDQEIPPVEMASYTAVANFLLNLDETLSKE